MKSVKAILAELKNKGNELRIKAFANHGAPADRLFGVSTADLKTIAKKIKGEQELAYELFDTGNCDAMQLAGLVADGSQMTKKLLDSWARKASWFMIAEFVVPRVATESEHARDLALKWMKARKELVAACGWATYAGYVTVTPDEELDLAEIEAMLALVEKEIDNSMNRVKYTMNGFVIAVGSYVKPLLKKAKALAKKLGVVEVELGGSACKVPLASDAIFKVEKAGKVGKKRKSIKC